MYIYPVTQIFLLLTHISLSRVISLSLLIKWEKESYFLSKIWNILFFTKLQSWCILRSLFRKQLSLSNWTWKYSLRIVCTLLFQKVYENLLDTLTKLFQLLLLFKHLLLLFSRDHEFFGCWSRCLNNLKDGSFEALLQLERLDTYIKLS